MVQRNKLQRLAMAKDSLSFGDFPAFSRTDWEALAGAALKSGDISRLETQTPDGIAISPIYEPAAGDLPGVHARAHANGLSWQVVQRCDISDIGLANRQMLEDLENGASGISLVLPGSACAASWGVPVVDMSGLRSLFKGVDLDLIALRLDGGAAGSDAATMLIDLYREQNLDLTRCALSLGLD
ncbi:MAG TPA: methylmalonyl-CoA mutase, partial [Rhizobiales bacterium]|nr:methylmalonyl-CoA mutase [Hyphomicrobiales bacterium]